MKGRRWISQATKTVLIKAAGVLHRFCFELFLIFNTCIFLFSYEKHSITHQLIFIVYSYFYFQLFFCLFTVNPFSLTTQQILPLYQLFQCQKPTYRDTFYASLIHTRWRLFLTPLATAQPITYHHLSSGCQHQTLTHHNTLCSSMICTRPQLFLTPPKTIVT